MSKIEVLRGFEMRSELLAGLVDEIKWMLVYTVCATPEEAMDAWTDEGGWKLSRATRRKVLAAV